jgi:aspartyl protease family protein
MLADRFPGRLSTREDWTNVLYLVGVLALVSSSVVFARQFTHREVLRNLAIWGGFAAVLAVGFAYQSELRSIALRVRSELVPGYAVSTDPGVLVLTEGGGGHFFVVSEVNGLPVRFLVDTGASDIVLSPDDARRLGIAPDSLRYTRVFRTANGAVRGAPYNLASLKIGPIELSNVPVSINQAEMDTSLLGMTFLNRLESFEFRGRQLFLRTR